MSTSSVSPSSSTTGATTGYLLSSLGTNSAMQITGLASGLNTNQIIQEEMSIYSQPVTNLQNQQNGISAQAKALSSVQAELQGLVGDAQALGDPSLFANTQTVTSTSPALVTATATNSGAGAVIGGYQVGVNNLASSAQRTFAFTSKSTANTVTIDNQSVSLAAGASAQDLANAVNGKSNMDVWATVTSSGDLVFSDRATGAQTGNYIQVSDTGGALAEQTQLANAGQNASYTINGGTPLSSPSNSVTSAIPGVTLTFNGVTSGGAPATINVGAPAPSTSNIQTAVGTFITQYNKVISDLQTQLSTPPSSSDPTVGTLYQDPELQGLLSSMRSAMYASQDPTSTSSIQSMLNIGVSTGATTGSGAVSQSALSGALQLNSTTLSSALQSDPLGTQQMLVGFAATFSSLVGGVANPGGTIDSRIQGDNSQISNLGSQISAMQASLTDRQNQLVQTFSQLESALSSNQSTSAWLTSQIASLPGA
ncbi:MAG TPA: flagellar filament capping protein FliD [Solirubrobacteraceae bacterium]|jgi:flagellar hook-associated protein 2|nr:flagellar filament capping protein FliD [Solirubrobacteraceae bacterium]